MTENTLVFSDTLLDKFASKSIATYWEYVDCILSELSDKQDSEMSLVAGVLQIYYLFSCAGWWLIQHCCVIATVIIYKSLWLCFA